MSEAEMTVPIERESGAVKRVTEKVGQFLKETYTRQGVIVKDMRRYAKLTENDTFYTRRDKMAQYEKLAEKACDVESDTQLGRNGCRTCVGRVNPCQSFTCTCFGN